MPRDSRRDRCEQLVEEGGEVRLGAAVADHALDLAAGDVEDGDQGLGAVAHKREHCLN